MNKCYTNGKAQRVVLDSAAPQPHKRYRHTHEFVFAKL